MDASLDDRDTTVHEQQDHSHKHCHRDQGIYHLLKKETAKITQQPF